jgi:hypothetical protein
MDQTRCKDRCTRRVLIDLAGVMLLLVSVGAACSTSRKARGTQFDISSYCSGEDADDGLQTVSSLGDCQMVEVNNDDYMHLDIEFSDSNSWPDDLDAWSEYDYYSTADLDSSENPQSDLGLDSQGGTDILGSPDGAEADTTILEGTDTAAQVDVDIATCGKLESAGWCIAAKQPIVCSESATCPPAHKCLDGECTCAGEDCIFDFDCIDPNGVQFGVCVHQTPNCGVCAPLPKPCSVSSLCPAGFYCKDVAGEGFCQQVCCE